MARSARLAAVVILALVISAGGAVAQNGEVDEAVGNGALIPTPTPSAAQESAIHSAVMGQKTKPSAVGIAPEVGAPVPPALELPALPAQASSAFGDDRLLKYAIVERDVVVIDPVIMRVIDVIHGWARP